MNTIIKVLDNKIDVSIEDHIIRITNNDALTNLLTYDTEARTAQLVHSIKVAYYKLFNKNLEVSDTSMIVEIWGHVYTEKFADAVKSATSFKLINKLAEKIIERCGIIDIGERAYDYNRFVWDGLAHAKSIIAKFLPGNSGELKK
ncbi:MAG: hypothetical protein ABJA35_14585 [Parafilimonas sp.]